MQPAVTVSHLKFQLIICCYQRTSTIVNSSLHLQFIFSWWCDAQRVLAHLSLSLDRAVFTGEPIEPDMQNRGFEYQQHVSMASDC